MRNMNITEATLYNQLIHILDWVENGWNEPLKDVEAFAGICSHLSWSTQYLFTTICQQWKEYSGSRVYPVPSTVASIDAQDMYVIHCNKASRNRNHKGMFQGVYGQKRMELLRFAIWWLKAGKIKRTWYKLFGGMYEF